MYHLIPLPSSTSTCREKFTLTPKTAICVPADKDEIHLVGQLLADHLRPACGYELPVLPAGTAVERAITLTTESPEVELGAEGYDLTIDPGGIILSAFQPAGLFRGLQTIRQLLPPAIESPTRQPDNWQVDCGTIRDLPRFKWRGVMLDVARHFFDVAQVKRLIDQLAYYKMNILHLHLTDDQGWRLMIRSWQRLAEFGGSTDFTGGAGGFYTQDEYRQIVEYAKARYITIVPEVDMPAHINSALACYAELNEDGKAHALSTGYGEGSSSLAISKEITYRFLSEVLAEVAAITPGSYIHIGGDEALSTSEADYRYFIQRVQEIARAQGKHCIGWEEISQADLLPDTIVQHWLQASLAQQAACSGHQLILSPASKIYLDMKYDASTTLGQDWAGPIEVQDAYDWDPAQLLEEVTEDQILGVEAPLWTETVITRSDMDYMFFPRLLACAEIGWAPREKRNWLEFRQRLANHGPRLEAMGIEFHRSPQVEWE